MLKNVGLQLRRSCLKCRQNHLYVNNFFDQLNERKHNFLQGTHFIRYKFNKINFLFQAPSNEVINGRDLYCIL